MIKKNVLVQFDAAKGGCNNGACGGVFSCFVLPSAVSDCRKSMAEQWVS